LPELERLELMAEVARYYYEQNLNQAQIGKLFGISHSTVSRLLRDALEEKVIEVIIHYPFKTSPALENELLTRFRYLKGVHVLPVSIASYKEHMDKLGQFAAKLLVENLEDGLSLGISLGMAVAATVKHVRVIKPMHIRVVRLQGATEGELMEGTDLAQTLAAQMGNEAMIIPSPWVLRSAESQNLILLEQSVQEVIRIAEAADIGLVGIGCTECSYSTIFHNQLISESELKTLKDIGAIGEICGKYFDRQGNVLDIGFNHRTVSIQLECLRNYRNVIGVAGRPAKAEAIIAAIRGGYIKTLVTDSETAKRILNLTEKQI